MDNITLLAISMLFFINKSQYKVTRLAIFISLYKICLFAEVFVFETEDNGKSSPPGEEQVPLYHLMDHLDLNLPQAAGETEDNSSLELQGNLLYFICHHGVPMMSMSVCCKYCMY
jgi:hypothetical protein